MNVSPQQQARSCCNPLLLRQDEPEGFFASELPSSPDGWPFLVPGASGWTSHSPCSVTLPQHASWPLSPLLSRTAIIGVTLASSQGLPGSHFWQNPGLLPSALPSGGWLHPVRKGGATGEERWGAPGQTAAGRRCLDAHQDKWGQPSPRHKGLSVRDTPHPACNLGGSCFLTQRRSIPSPTRVWPGG